MKQNQCLLRSSHEATQKVGDQARKEIADAASFIDKLREKGKTPQQIIDFLLNNMDIGGEKSAVSAQTWHHLVDFIENHTDEKATDILNPDTEIEKPTPTTEQPKENITENKQGQQKGEVNESNTKVGDTVYHNGQPVKVVEFRDSRKGGREAVIELSKRTKEEIHNNAIKVLRDRYSEAKSNVSDEDLVKLHSGDYHNIVSDFNKINETSSNRTNVNFNELSKNENKQTENKQTPTVSEKSKPEPTRQEKVNDLLDRTDKFNKLAKNAKDKASELNAIRIAADELGLNVDYGKGFARIKSDKGNKVQRRSTVTNKTEADFKPEDYSDRTKATVQRLSDDEGMILGLDIEGADGKNLSAQQRTQALKDIKEGKNTVGAKAVYDALEKMHKDDMVHWKNPETGERMGIPFEDYFAEPSKEISDDELNELNSLLGEDAFNETVDNTIYDYEHSDTEDKQSSEETADSGKENPVGDTKDSKGKQKTNEQKAVDDQLQAAREELSTATDAFKDKRKELDKDIQEDTPDLFGERKSQQESKLFDERVDPEAKEKALQPFKDRMAKAKAEVERLEAKQKDYADKTTAQRNLLDAIEEEKNMASESEQPYFDKREAVAKKYGKDIDQIIKDLKDEERLKVDCPPGTKRRLSLKDLMTRKK